jgi:hypothetical protein
MSALALAGLALVGGGILWAVKAHAEKQESDESSLVEVTASSGITYLTADTFREVDGQTVAIVGVMTEDETPILVYQQFAGDQATRIWDKAAGGLPTNDPRWLAAVQDFGVFTSV